MSAKHFVKSAYDSAALPRQLFGFNVVDFLGEGAGSKIYVVNSSTSQQLLALKHVIRTDEKDIRFVEQLEAEFEVSRQFRHPGLRRTLDLKINKTLLRRVTDAALIMELVDGTPLDAQPPQKLTDMLSVFAEVANALAALHHLGYVHCDLKPNNIMLTGTGAKLIDFGQTCKVGTVKERIQGTPDYISPEQVRCEPVTHRTDIFNFGATMYWGLTGQKIPTLFTIKRSENSFLVDSEIPAPHEVNSRIPEPLSNLVMDCCRTNAAKRPGDIGEIARRLETMQYGLTRAQSKTVAPQPRASAVA
jgi:serine/threonine protein kinase